MILIFMSHSGISLSSLQIHSEDILVSDNGTKKACSVL